MSAIHSKRLTRQWTHTLPVTAAKLFPLLCPVREYEWIPIWSCRMIHSDSGLAENNCVFTTSLPGEAEKVWTVSRYEPEATRIEFVIVTPGSQVEKLEAVARDRGDGGCDLTWTRIYTPLSSAGEAAAAQAAGPAFDQRMTVLGRMLQHYLETGETLEIDEI